LYHGSNNLSADRHLLYFKKSDTVGIPSPPGNDRWRTMAAEKVAECQKLVFFAMANGDAFHLEIRCSQESQSVFIAMDAETADIFNSCP
jgi:hypothetical protein